jgi:hypothetical protein
MDGQDVLDRRLLVGQFHFADLDQFLGFQAQLASGVAVQDDAVPFPDEQGIAATFGLDAFLQRQQFAGRNRGRHRRGCARNGRRCDSPPKVRLTVRPEVDEYTARRRSLVIRHVSRHRIVALVEILSPGNKASRHGIRSFVSKAVSALTNHIHLLLVDLFPPGPRDPQGIHGAVWQELADAGHEQPPDKPLTLAAYSAGPIPVAYVEPVAVGDVLPDMPLFLTPEDYINAPLEATYRAAYSGVPRFYRDILEP